MDFNHTEDRRMLADMLTRFVSEQYDFTVREKAAHSEEGFSRELWERYAELGAIGALFPETEGGMGGAGYDISIVFEALGRGLAVEPFLGALMAGSALVKAGTPAQKERLEALMAGQEIAAFAHAEPETHYEETLVRTRAEQQGEAWVLNGSKAVVDGGEHAQWFVVSARTAGEEDAADGISLFLVPSDAEGVAIRGYGLIDGGRAAEVTLNDVHLGSDALIGAAGEGYDALEFAMGRGLLALSAEAVGALDVARDATLEYLQTRKQFGVPIGKFQALQHRMADILLEIEQARSAVINAASRLEADDRATRERALSAAKYTVGRVGTMAAEAFIQLHGGIGMTWELPLAHYAKRLVMIDHQLGDTDHHLQRYIALGRA
jgi:Acyl-CoA dehydrogenases